MLPFRYRRVQRSGKGEAKDVAGLGRIDHAIVPQPGRGMIGVALILIFLPDGGLEGFGFLRGPFVCVAVDGGEQRGRLLSPPNSDPSIGQGELEKLSIGEAKQAVINRDEASTATPVDHAPPPPRNS